MNETRDDAQETASIETGDTVYDDDGRVLGIVTEFTDEGFAVQVVQAGPSVSDVDHDDHDGEDTEDIPGKDFGEGYLMWRCEDCGEMGDLDDGIPEQCPECGAPKEHIHMAQED
jgi:rubredoxin